MRQVTPAPQPFQGVGPVAAQLALDKVHHPATLAGFVVVPHRVVEMHGHRPVGAIPELAASRQAVVGLAEQPARDRLSDG